MRGGISQCHGATDDREAQPDGDRDLVEEDK